MRAFDLSQYGISVRNIFHNASPAKLYEEAIRHEPGTSVSSTGALIAYSGATNGR
jgi:phosphoenolpyruvate carboxykinase (ATP)